MASAESMASVSTTMVIVAVLRVGQSIPRLDSPRRPRLESPDHGGDDGAARVRPPPAPGLGLRSSLAGLHRARPSGALPEHRRALASGRRARGILRVPVAGNGLSPRAVSRP